MRKDTIKRQLIRLADAMMKGGKKRQQCTSVLFEVQDLGEINNKNGDWITKYKLGGSCALGAVYEGLFGAPPITETGQVNGGESEMYSRLTTKLPVLELNLDDVGADSDAPFSWVQDEIIHRNDSGTARWKIARWLRQIAARL